MKLDFGERRKGAGSEFELNRNTTAFRSISICE